jgi:ABC-type transport system involved in cytochrome c biogenesis permease component
MGDIDRAQRWLTGLAVGTGALALASAVGVALGVRSRLEEYR